MTVLQAEEADFRSEALNLVKSHQVVRGEQGPGVKEIQQPGDGKQSRSYTGEATTQVNKQHSERTQIRREISVHVFKSLG